jgi:hypothetical protein
MFVIDKALALQEIVFKIGKLDIKIIKAAKL